MICDELKEIINTNVQTMIFVQRKCHVFKHENQLITIELEYEKDYSAFQMTVNCDIYERVDGYTEKLKE